MPSSDNTNLRNQIRRYRRRRHLRMQDTARLIGCPNRPTLSRWESGRTMPSLNYALKLSAAFGCPLEVLFPDHFEEYRRQVRERSKRLGISAQYD